MPKRTPSGKKTAVADVEVAWAAGFFEGEGGISTRHVLVSQVNRRPLERLVTAFGGTIGLRARDRRHNAERIWQWWICGKDGREFIDAIYPYLSPRRQEQINTKFRTNAKHAIIRKIEREKQADRVRNTYNEGRLTRNPITGRWTNAS